MSTVLASSSHTQGPNVKRGNAGLQAFDKIISFFFSYHMEIHRELVQVWELIPIYTHVLPVKYSGKIKDMFLLPSFFFRFSVKHNCCTYISCFVLRIWILLPCKCEKLGNI